MNLENKVVVVTGGAQGLGLTMAKALAAKGAKLALVDINQESLDAAVAGFADSGVEVKGYATNVADEESVMDLMQNVVDDFGAINGLINNAGITRDGLTVKERDGEITKMTLAQWQMVIDINLTGVFLCGREAAAKMIELKQEGVIINISSLSRAGNFGQINYSAAKAGVAAMATVWSKEFAKHNIRSAAIAPGLIATDMVAGMKQEALDKLAAGIPVGRLGQPEEIAQMAVTIFENGYINGRVFEVDGGMRI